MNRIRWYGPTVALVVTVLFVMIAGPGIVRQITYAGETAKLQLIQNNLKERTSTGALAELSDAFRNVARVVEPSVVSIEVSSRSSRRGGGGMGPGGMTPDEQLRRFFGPRFRAPVPDDDEEGDAPTNRGGPDNFERYNAPQPFGSGSGWVYDEAGHIITNNHVVKDADVITLTFADESKRTATVVGADPMTDIAVLKVDGGNLHSATRASEGVEQGDIVFAFGSPFRFNFSMSQGIVSAKGRSLHIVAEGQGYEYFIQTDAAINPGNSGGPLTNIRGEVVGMNTAIASQTGSYNGLGFAIPVDMVDEVVKQIIKSGKVTRGYLGIYISDLEPQMAESFGFTGKGVLVDQPIANSPGAKAGIKHGDIITKIDGKPVTSATELRRRVASYGPGAKIPVEYFRNGKTETVDVTIAPQPVSMARGPGAPSATPEKLEDKKAELLRKLGLESVREFTPDLATQMKAEFTPGVLISQVRPGSEADSKRLGRGTVITEVQGKPVKNPDELVAELSKAKKAVRLTIIVGGVQHLALLEIPKD